MKGFLIIFLLSLTTFSKAGYNFCYGKLNNGTIFCSKINQGKGNKNQCKYWSKSQYNNRYKWGYKYDSNKSNLLNKRESYCDEIINGTSGSSNNGNRYFYLGTWDEYSEAGKVIKFKLTEEQYKKYITYEKDYYCGGVITCNYNDTYFILEGQPRQDAALFSIEEGSEYPNYVSTIVPNSHENFSVMGIYSFALSSTLYRETINDPYYKYVPQLFPEKLFNNMYETFNIGGFSCNYGFQCE